MAYFYSAAEHRSSGALRPIFAPALIGTHLVNLNVKNDVAILYSVDSANALDFMPFTTSRNRKDYSALVEQIHNTLFRLNVGVDFIYPQRANFSDYKLVIVPALYIADDALLRQISAYVKSGGHVVMTFKSGFADENSFVRAVRAPGPLREAAGFSYQEFSSLKTPVALKGDPFHVGKENSVQYWAEFLQPEHAKVLASYDDPFLGQWAAITENSFGSGTLLYEGAWLSSALQSQVLQHALKDAKLTGPDQSLPAAIRAKSGVNALGNEVRYFINYSSAEIAFPYEHNDGTDLLTGQPIAHDAIVKLKPWDLVIVEESRKESH